MKKLALILIICIKTVFPNNQRVVEPKVILADSVNLISSNLPIVVINTFGQEIPDSGKIMARMGIIWNGDGNRNYITDPFNHYDGYVGIEVRGSSSQMFPKKSYAVETRDSLGNDRSVPLLGLPAEEDWIFYGPYNDKTLIRDVIAYKLASDLGRYASRSKFFELVINGEYKGIYILLEKIKRDANRVNIKKISPSDTTGDALTGGYIIKIDKLDGENNDGWYSYFRPFQQRSNLVFYQYHYPKPNEIIEVQKNYIKSFIYAFESAMYGPYYSDTTFGYWKYIDVNSFVDYILINELVKNVDAYRLSTFFYKDRDSRNPKLFAGPVWDFNLAFGNANYYEAYTSNGWYLEHVSEYSNIPSWENWLIPFWWKKIFGDYRFKQLVKERWQQLRQIKWTETRINSIIDSLTTLLAESRQRNFQKWPVIGQWIWPNYFVGQTYEEEILYLKNWLSSRLIWMDQEFNSFQTTVESKNSLNNFILYQNFPNPFNSITKIRFSLKENDKVLVKLYDVLGREISVILGEFLPTGTYEIPLDAEYLKLSNGIYFYELICSNFSDIKKMVYLK